jgi:hypothetical protein
VATWVVIVSVRLGSTSNLTAFMNHINVNKRGFERRGSRKGNIIDAFLN